MLSDGKGRPLDFFLSPGQMVDSQGALVLMRQLPPAKRFLGDKSFDPDWLRDGLRDRGIRSCIPPRKRRRKPSSYGKRLCRKRYRIENAFGSLKGWRGIAANYGRCGGVFLNALILAVIVIFWI